MESQSINLLANPSDQVVFYNKFSSFDIVNEFSSLGSPNEYPLLISQQNGNASELILANTDRTIQLIDLNKGVI
jgi:hypothetical protein